MSTTFVIFAWLVSTEITLLHTLDEIASRGGPIWRYLAPGLPGWLTAPPYFAFQGVSIWLAWGWMHGARWALPWLAGIRVVDILVTHMLLPRIKSPNPGHATRWLLLWDVGVLVLCR